MAAIFSSLEFPFILEGNIRRAVAEAAEAAEASSKINFETILKNSLVELNESFLNKSTSDSGATAVITLQEINPNLNINKIHCIWVGDSEAFVLKNEKRKFGVKLEPELEPKLEPKPKHHPPSQPP